MFNFEELFQDMNLGLTGTSGAFMAGFSCQTHECDSRRELSAWFNGLHEYLAHLNKKANQ